MSAHTGIVLNTSEKSFHSFRLYFLLPKLHKLITLIIEPVESIDA